MPKTIKKSAIGEKCKLSQNINFTTTDIDPQRTRSYFWGFTPLCQICGKSTKKCDRESEDTRTDRQMQTDFIICPMLYAIAMGQIIKMQFVLMIMAIGSVL